MLHRTQITDSPKHHRVQLSIIFLTITHFSRDHETQTTRLSDRKFPSAADSLARNTHRRRGQLQDNSPCPTSSPAPLRPSHASVVTICSFLISSHRVIMHRDAAPHPWPHTRPALLPAASASSS